MRIPLMFTLFFIVPQWFGFFLITTDTYTFIIRKDVGFFFSPHFGKQHSSWKCDIYTMVPSMYDLGCGLLDIMEPCKPHTIPDSQKTLNQMHDWRRENRNMESLSWEVLTSLAPLNKQRGRNQASGKSPQMGEGPKAIAKRQIRSWRGTQAGE